MRTLALALALTSALAGGAAAQQSAEEAMCTSLLIRSERVIRVSAACSDALHIRRDAAEARSLCMAIDGGTGGVTAQWLELKRRPASPSCMALAESSMRDVLAALEFQVTLLEFLNRGHGAPTVYTLPSRLAKP